jgi:flagellin
MSLGVLNNLNAVYAENNLNNTSNSLSTVLQQLSSGSKINSGADDAAGLSLVNGLQANEQALTQSATNATEGVGLLKVADGALSQVTSLLNRAVTLATEASNGTLNSSQDSAANSEYQSILSEISNIGSTTTYNQQSVFGSSTSIYTGDSSSTGASVDSLNIRSLSSSNVGDSKGAMSYSNGTNNVFINLSSGGENAAVSDSLGASTATTSINVGFMTTGASGTAVSSTATISVGAGTSYDNTAQGLISAINNSGLGLNATFATATQSGSAAVASAETTGGSGTDTGIEISGAGIGTGTNGVGVVGSMALDSSDKLSGTLNIVGSDGASHNIALGTANSTDNLVSLASTINAAGYGVTASVNQAGTQLTFTSANSAVAVTGTNIAENTTATTANTTIQGSVIGSMSVGGASDKLTGTLNVTSGVDGTTGHAIQLGTLGSTDTLQNLAASFTGNGANVGLGITAALSNNNTTITFSKSSADADTPAITTSNLVDVAAPIIVTGATLGSLTLAVAGDAIAKSGGAALDIISGVTGKAVTPLALGTVGSTDTLANLATTINNGGYGITAGLDSTGTILTFTANAGNTFTAVVAGAGTIDDNTYPTQAAVFNTGKTTLGSITVQGYGDTVGDTVATDGLSLSGNGQVATKVDLNTTPQTLAQIANTINGADSAFGIVATLNQAGTTLTFSETATAAGVMSTGAIVVTPTSALKDNVAAVTTTAAVTSQNGTLGVLNVLSAGNTLTGTLNFTEGKNTSETVNSFTATNLTLAQIADNFNNAKTYSSSTPTDWSAAGITATLNQAGTQLVFTQASGDLGIAAISTAATAPLTEAPVIATGSTLGSLVVNQKSDTLGGTLNLTNGITGQAQTLTLGTFGSTDTLANLATTITNGGYGITATANTAGTMLTFMQTSGTATASIGNTASISDTTAAVTQTPINVIAGTPDTVTAVTKNDMLSGTLNITSTTGAVSQYNFAGQTLQ